MGKTAGKECATLEDRQQRLAAQTDAEGVRRFQRGALAEHGFTAGLGLLADQRVGVGETAAIEYPTAGSSYLFSTSLSVWHD